MKMVSSVSPLDPRYHHARQTQFRHPVADMRLPSAELHHIRDPASCCQTDSFKCAEKLCRLLAYFNLC